MNVIRDGLKIDPNSSTCHGLMGLVYLKQNLLSVAKPHINKAWQSNPQDPVAIEAKQELDKLMKSSDKKGKKKDGKSSLGIFSNISLFGKKK